MALTRKQQHQGKTHAYAVAYSLFVALLPLSLCLYVTGDATNDLDLSFMGGVMVLFAANVIYAFLNLRDRLLFLFLHMGIALFLLSRPFISIAAGHADWWMFTSFESLQFSIAALYLSMACLLGATVLCGAICSHNKIVRMRASRALPNKLLPAPSADCSQAKMRALLPVAGKVFTPERVRIIRIAALIAYAVCLVGAYYAGYIKLSYMSGRVYTDFYLVDSADYIPWAVDLLAIMAPYMLCAYLATMPRRGGVVVCLAAYVATTLPMLMIGSRSDFVIAFLFAALYFVFRAVTDKQQVWISKRLVIVCCLLIPVGVVAMGLMDYLRAGSTTNLGFVDLVVDALYKQGVSFTVLGHGYEVNDQIQQLGFRFYTMGGLITTFTQGFIGQTFFDFPLLPTTNSYELATQGFSYSHAMSFFAHENYLGGEGYGSSYILELFADFGYVGIGVGSFAIGLALFLLSHALGRSWFWGMCALVSATNVFHMPRGYFDEWISYIWSTRFLLAVAGLIALSALLYFVSKRALAAKQAREQGRIAHLRSDSLRKPARQLAAGVRCMLGSPRQNRAGRGKDAQRFAAEGGIYGIKGEHARTFPLNARNITVVGCDCIREVR